MEKGKKLLSVFVIVFSIILIPIPLVFPNPGGVLLTILGIFWFCYQIRKYSEFIIPKAYLLFFVLIIYLMIFGFYSKPIPTTHILTQRALILFFFAILSNTAMRSTSDRIPWENALIIIAFFVSIRSMIEIYGWYDRYSLAKTSLQVLPYPQIAYRLSGGIFGHPNPLAGFLNFVWPIVLIRLLSSKQVSRKILWGAGLLLFAISIFYTNSRGALMGAIAGMLVIVVTLILGKSSNFKERLALPKLNKQGVITILTSVGLLLILSLGVMWRTNFTGQVLSKSFSGRATIWKYSWEGFVESPIFGQGIGAFPISYAKFAQIPPGEIPPSTHNLWLQVAVDYGIIGLLYICILMIVYVVFGIKKQRSNLNTHPHFSLAYLAGGSAFLAQHTVDYMLVTIYYLVVLVMILILTTKYALSLGEWKINRKWFAAAGGAIIGLIAIYQGNIGSKINYFTEDSIRTNLANTGQWELLQRQICSNLDRNSNNALYNYECSQAISLQMSKQQHNNEVNRSLLNQALLFQQSGHELNPYWAMQEANLAVLFWVKGEHLTALDYMKHAADAAPMYDILWINLGWMEEYLDNQEAALNAYTRALRINPLIAKSTFVEQSSLIAKASEDLFQWAESEHLWFDWYDGNRHDRAKYDHDYWRGVIELSTDQNELAVESLEASLNRGSIPHNLAFAYELNGQSTKAFGAALDIASLKRSGIRNFGSPYELSMIASILRRNGETDIAYQLFTETINNIKTENVYGGYYKLIYGKEFLISDISPWLIRSHLILMDTKEDWVWFAEEAYRRGDIQLFEDINFWQIQLQGIARFSD